MLVCPMLDASFDVVVAGGGAVGACTALELTGSGAKVAAAAVAMIATSPRMSYLRNSTKT
jgi:glycine/D-amino acid oxidase-like deaminating enzyme